MTRNTQVRVGMSALAAIMIIGLALGATASPAYAGCGPFVNCNELFCRLTACENNNVGNPPAIAACKAAVYQDYYANYSNEFDIDACFGATCKDGRVNQNCSAPEIVYCDEDTIEFWAYNYFTGEGEFDFSIPTADLQQSVNAKTLIAQNGQVKVYLMPNSTVLLLAPQTDGKIYFMEFNPYVCVSTREGAEWGLK